jgi:hypothetical protein
MAAFTRVEEVADPCHPTYFNPISCAKQQQQQQQQPASQQLMVVAARPIPADAVVAMYFGDVLTQA